MSRPPRVMKLGSNYSRSSQASQIPQYLS